MLASYLQLTQAVCALVILLSHTHLLPLFFCFFTWVHLLIDSSVEGQYITVWLFSKSMVNKNKLKIDSGGLLLVRLSWLSGFWRFSPLANFCDRSYKLPTAWCFLRPWLSTDLFFPYCNSFLFSSSFFAVSPFWQQITTVVPSNPTQPSFIFLQLALVGNQSQRKFSLNSKSGNSLISHYLQLSSDYSCKTLMPKWIGPGFVMETRDLLHQQLFLHANLIIYICWCMNKTINIKVNHVFWFMTYID